MIEEGASLLFGADQPQLRFATEEDAEAARKRLGARLPGSEAVWNFGSFCLLMGNYFLLQSERYANRPRYQPPNQQGKDKESSH